MQVHENVKATFLPNGHLMGAALILVQISCSGYEDINILFTGDYNSKNIFFDVPPVPDWVKRLPLTIVQESTYGDMNSSEIVPCFRDNVEKHIAQGGTVIAPVFSLGRSQEILYELKCMQEEGRIPTSVPIYLDGRLAHRYTDLYLRDGLGMKPEMHDFLPQNFAYVDNTTRPTIMHDGGAKIVCTTSGMGSYGPAPEYIREYIARGDALIHFTGYTPEGTLGARLKETAVGDTVQIGGVLKKKLARVEYTSEYSAHAKADEMIAFLKQFQNLKLVLVNHGEVDVKETFANRILHEVDPKDVGILGNGYFFRINPYGLVKTSPTKFK
jgi:metallo-beta-lactamase family protein